MNTVDKKNDILSISIIFSGLIALSAVFFEWVSPIRNFLVLAFFLTSPGAAYVQLFNIRDGFSFFTLSIALSLVLSTSVALILLYLNRWSPFWSLLILFYLSLAGVILKIVSENSKKTRTE